MTPFVFQTATEIVFGRGEAARALPRLAALGARVALVHGRDAARVEWAVQGIAPVVTLSVPHEPDLPLIEALLSQARALRVDAVVAIGGGAVIDAGKALAALIPATRPVIDHLEVVGQGLPLDHAPLPFAALPTTAGTGAEVTKNAVIGVPDAARKVSLRDARMLPRLAIVDPALTDGCPRGITLASGLDAITQVIEPFVSTRATPFTDAICCDAILRGMAALMRLMGTEDAQARDDMAYTSLCGGIALANAGLGAVHGLAGPLGGLTAAPHGAICGALLPHILGANRAGASDLAAIKLDLVAGWLAEALGCAPTVDAVATALALWSQNAGLPRLSAHGITPAHLEQTADMAATSSSMKSNPVALPAPALLAAMQAAY